ncbi:MAG: hypothetical protein KDA17_03785 [Candidatus Saccharibacteria bacterium]|nr:hypothetical protein [Candidatus Saccharibacteria bacterium]
MPARYSNHVSDSGVDWDTDSPAASLTLSSNSDRKLLIFVTRERDNPERFVTSIDVSGSPATKLVRADTGAATTEFKEDVDLWYYDVGAGESGSKTVTPSLTGASNNDWSLHVIEIYNAATGAPTLYHANQSTGAGSLSFSLASCPANSIVVACAVANAGVPSTGIYMTGGVYTELAEEVTVPGHSAAGLLSQCIYKELSTGGTETPSFTKTADTTQDMAGVAVCVEEYSAASGVTGDTNQQLDDATLSATGTVSTAGGVSGSLNVTLDDATVSSDAVSPVSAELSVALGDAVLSSSATVAGGSGVTANAGITLDDATLDATAGVRVRAVFFAQLEDATLDSTASLGTFPSTGILSVTLDDAVLSSDAGVLATADLDVTLDDAVLSAAAGGIAQITADLSVTLDDAQLSATAAGQAQVSGDLSVTLESAQLDSSATVAYPAITASLSITTDDATVDSSASVSTPGVITATLSVSLDDAVLDSNAIVPVFAVFAATTDDAVLNSAAVVLPLVVDGDESLGRRLAVTAENRVVKGGGGSYVRFKDLNAVLDYSVDWSEFLADVNDTIVESTWFVDDGLTKDSQSSGAVETVWISGGTRGVAYSVTNQIKTDGGRTKEQTILLRCEESDGRGFIQYKDPGSVLDFGVDWDQWLAGVSDTIQSHQWISELPVQAESNDTMGATIWLSGGEEGEVHIITSRITTVGGRTDDRSLAIRCEQM